MAQSIIDGICNSCSCSRKEAKEYLNGEIQHLRELKELDDLRFSDIVTACEGLGLEHDYVEYFIENI